MGEISFFGHVISKEEQLIHTQKIRALIEWKRPETVTEVRSFLGMAGYYRRFLEGFSRIALPLTQLLHKGVKLEWAEKQQRSFEELKNRLVTAPILALPIPGIEYTIHSDASVVEEVGRKYTDFNKYFS